VELKEGRSNAARDTIVNPRSLNRVDLVDFCGACHQTTFDIVFQNIKGLNAMRSQPFRLQQSRCWDKGDERITCIACHDPHEPLVPAGKSYDDACLACHVDQGAKPNKRRPGKPCPVESENCVKCHMPRYDVPNMHFKFLDHKIQKVAK
jgi:hypothetical protein